MLAYCKNDANIVKPLIYKYLETIEQRDFNGVTRFILVCNNNNIQVLKLFIQENPKVIEKEKSTMGILVILFYKMILRNK